ncbi:MAG TPA: sugar ABC transporter substrate-binding protein [Solirubrobacterales bacterium]
MKRFVGRLLFSLAAVLVLAVALAACGGSSSSDSGATTAAEGTESSSGSGAQAAGIKEAGETFDSLLAPPELKLVGEKFDAKKSAGKTVYYINTDDSIPITTIWREVAIEQLERYGVHVVSLDGKGSTTEYNKDMNTAISRGADAIFTMAVNPPLISQQIKAAKAAGIPVITGAEGLPNVKETATYVEGVTAGVSYDYHEVGKVEADWVAADSKGSAHVLFISNEDQPSSKYVVAEFEKELSRTCPDCTVEFKDVPAAQVTTTLPTLVQTSLQRDPEINYVVPGYDFNVPEIETGLRQAGLTDRVRIGSWNAVPAVMQSLQNKQSPMSMELGAPNNWFSFAIADTVMRTLSGVEPVVWGTEESAFMGFRAFDKESVEGLDVSEYDDAEFYELPDSKVQAAFEGLWGKP